MKQEIEFQIVTVLSKQEDLKYSFHKREFVAYLSEQSRRVRPCQVNVISTITIIMLIKFNKANKGCRTVTCKESPSSLFACRRRNGKSCRSDQSLLKKQTQHFFMLLLELRANVSTRLPFSEPTTKLARVKSILKQYLLSVLLKTEHSLLNPKH